jgi:hypothetical protein
VVAVGKALNIAAGGEQPEPTGWYWAGDKVPDQQEFAIGIKAVRQPPKPGGPG